MARLYGGSGRIKPTPAEIAANAQIAADRRRAKRPRGAAGVQALISEMANFMVDQANTHGNCTTDALKREGFSAEEIAAYADRAAARARSRHPNLRAA